MMEWSSGFTLDLVSELSMFLLVFINEAVYFSLGFLKNKFMKYFLVSLQTIQTKMRVGTAQAPTDTFRGGLRLDFRMMTISKRPI